MGWGFPLWVVIDVFGKALPDTKGKSLQQECPEVWQGIQNFTSSLRVLMPCYPCRFHFKDYYSEHIAEMKPTKEGFQEWFRTLRKFIDRRKNDGREDSRLDLAPHRSFVKRQLFWKSLFPLSLIVTVIASAVTLFVILRYRSQRTKQAITEQ